MECDRMLNFIFTILKTYMHVCEDMKTGLVTKMTTKLKLRLSHAFATISHACVCLCVFISGAATVRDHIVSVFWAGPGWEGWRWHGYKSHFSCGRSPKDQPGAWEAPSERWWWRHAICLFRLFSCFWNNREWTHDLSWIGEWLLWWWSTVTTEAQKRSPRQQGRIPHHQSAKLRPLTFSTYTEDQWGMKIGHLFGC